MRFIWDNWGRSWDNWLNMFATIIQISLYDDHSKTKFLTNEHLSKENLKCEKQLNVTYVTLRHDTKSIFLLNYYNAFFINTLMFDLFLPALAPCPSFSFLIGCGSWSIWSHTFFISALYIQYMFFSLMFDMSMLVHDTCRQISYRSWRDTPNTSQTDITELTLFNIYHIYINILHHIMLYFFPHLHNDQA